MSRSTVALVWLGSLLLAAGAGWWHGSDGAKAECEAAKVKPVVEVIERHNVAAVAGNAVERKAVRAESRQESFTRKLIQEASHAPIPPSLPGCDCGLDPYRMYRWRAANRGAPVDSTGAPDGAAAGGTAGAGEQLAGGSDREPYRVGGAVSPAAGAVQGPGGMGGEDR